MGLTGKVVDAGSFAKAAEETHRSQSSVSYNLSLLQERLGVALLAPEGRRAVLTPAGELLLGRVKPLLKAFSYVETRAATLRNGMRTRLDWWWTRFSHAAACSPFCVSSSSSIRKLRSASRRCWKIPAPMP